MKMTAKQALKVYDEAVRGLSISEVLEQLAITEGAVRQWRKFPRKNVRQATARQVDALARRLAAGQAERSKS